MPGIKTGIAVLSSAGLLLFGNTLAQTSEKSVKMKNLPTEVQKTVREQSMGATIRGLSQETEDGKIYYEVELKVKGHNKDVLIDSTGAVVEIEEEIDMASVPPAVKAEIEKHIGSGKITMVESVTKNDAIVAYEAHIKSGKKHSEVKVGPDGQLIATESDEDEAKEKAGTKKSSHKTQKP
ncbi:MAG: hypothetical protein AABO41_22675 [Acidobacteriota bacterium]